MKVFLVLAHPEPQSFNASLTSAAVEALEREGHTTSVSDLYVMNFDPVSDRRNFTTVKDASYYKQQAEELHATQHDGFDPVLRGEMAKLEACDALVLQFPLWWFGMPAIMKGWVDRVFAAGRVYGGGKWYDHGAFAGKRAICSVTIGGPASMYTRDGLNGPIDEILFPINHGMLAFTGFSVLPAFLVHGPARMSDAERKTEIARWCAHVLQLGSVAPIEYPKLSEFDPSTWSAKSPQRGAR